MAKVKIGDVVVYKTTKADRSKMKTKKECNEVDTLPAIVVAVHADSVNLKVLLDGTGEVWKTSVEQGHDEGFWNVII